jgi:hypothetical protein
VRILELILQYHQLVGFSASGVLYHIYMTKLFTMGRSKYRPPIVKSFVIYCSGLSKFCFVRPSIATSFLFPVTYASVHTIVCLHSSVGSRPNSVIPVKVVTEIFFSSLQPADPYPTCHEAFRICYVLIYITYCSILPTLTHCMVANAVTLLLSDFSKQIDKCCTNWRSP